MVTTTIAKWYQWGDVPYVNPSNNTRFYTVGVGTDKETDLAGINYSEMHQKGDVDGGYNAFEDYFGYGFGYLTSLTAKPIEGANAYVSYSEGVLPGSHNSMFDTLSGADLAAFKEQYPDIQEDIGEETLKAYELGWKQTLLDNKLYFSVVGFHQKWDNMKSTGLIIFVPPSTGAPVFFTPTIPGSSTQKGVEVEANWLASDNLQFNLAYGYTDAKYDDFLARSMNSILGLVGVNYYANGKTMPRSPKHSAAFSATWTNDINENWEYRVRGDLLYRGETYTDELNITTIAGYTLFNLHLDFENQNGLGFGLYCDNCFDEEGWATGRRLTDFGDIPLFFANQGAVVDPIRPREIGLRVSYRF